MHPRKATADATAGDANTMAKHTPNVDPPTSAPTHKAVLSLMPLEAHWFECWMENCAEVMDK